MDPLSKTLGKAFEGLFDQVDSTILNAVNAAKKAGLELEMEAGRQIGMAIENAKNAYEDSLEITVDKVSKEVKAVFDQLESMVQTFQKETLDEIQNLKVKAHELVEKLPFASKQPRLSRVSPQYVVIDSVARNALVTFEGDFSWVAETGYTPTLSFKDRRCFLFKSTTQQLTFEVPKEVFQAPNNSKYSYVSGNLQVPWWHSWLVVLGSKKTSNFRVGFGALPLSPGKITVEYESQRTENITQIRKTPKKPYNGNDWYPEHWHEIIEHYYPSPGWKIDISHMPELIAQHKHGKHNQKIKGYTANDITLEVNLYCKHGSDIGVVDIEIQFQEIKQQTVKEIRIEDVNLNWGDSVVLQPKDGEVISRLIFDSYNGKHQEFSAPDMLSSVLKVKSEGNGKWKLTAEIPKDVGLTLATTAIDSSEKKVEEDKKEPHGTLVEVTEKTV